MKLIYIVNVGLPGNWAHCIQVMKMCEAFAANGIEVELVTGLKRDTDENIFSYYNIKTKFKITKIPCLNLSAQGSGKLNFLIRSFSFLFFAKLYVLFKRYDVLYFRTPLAGLFFKDFYLETHELPAQIKKGHKRNFKKAKKIIVLTGFLKQELIKAGLEEKKIIVAPDAVNLKEFQIDLSKEKARRKLSWPLDKKIILYCGNLYFHDWKGVDILLESLKYLDNIFCVLIGNGKSDLEKIENDYGAENLMILGHKPHHEIPLCLRAADILILPNKKDNLTSEFFTSPLKLFEYMASGRPIVASDLPSIREILNETNAVLVEPNDPEELAEGIKKIAKDDILAKNLAAQASKDVAQYSWEKRAERIIKEFFRDDLK